LLLPVNYNGLDFTAAINYNFEVNTIPLTVITSYNRPKPQYPPASQKTMRYIY